MTFDARVAARHKAAQRLREAQTHPRDEDTDQLDSNLSDHDRREAARVQSVREAIRIAFGD